MMSTCRFNKFAALSLIAVSVLTLSACSKSTKTEMGTDPNPQSTAGNTVTSDYAEKPGVVETGTPNSQIDPYTGSSVKDNYAGKHDMASEQTAGEQLDEANQNMKEAAHDAGQNMREAGRDVKDASVRMKNKVKDEFDKN